MKKVTSDTLPFEDAATEYLIPSNRHSQEQPGPVSPVFTILPNVDTQSLLCHASETLASLNVMSTGLAGELQGAHRSMAMALQQLTELGELLVNRALENLEPPVVLQDASLNTQR
ncbi:hypothetical protein VP02_24075 [Pseudomonas ogarae]|uniref:DUF3077 domain-containing protein n=2 Tax=Pseudomonas TaxID=286 RepID=A0ABN5G2K7_PSEO1|nr:DUF6124 family protein [Pseudomonas ogarae]AEV60491.1 Hypothetical protein PSF113_0455 [Pseudomonas ogarae]AUO44373.1 hypothetical protein C1C98_02420 [Pseudomonas ogarae]KKA05246.1 hypothetical protein VP02_24075 [Pseudomonas ogarae]PBJ24533.1 hypothetical protein BSG18_15000 [Pseudomonas ogarae]